MGKKETFKAATARLLTEAKAADYEVQTRSSEAPWNDLKKPRIYRKHARRGYTHDAVEFTPQAVHDMADDRSLWIDIRGMSFDDFKKKAELDS